MRLTAAILLAVLTVGAPAASSQHLRVSGTHFVTPGGSPFAWKGITAFRLAEFVAHGRADDADAYLRWAASKGLTIVRVLAMADVLFKLSPADGRQALAPLLQQAQKHGLFVEVVALADTATIPFDIPRHVAAIGAVCDAHPNCVLELANEPGHPTQARTLHDPAYMKSLRALVPSDVPVSLGSVEYGNGYGDGSYVTWHVPRRRPLAALDHGAELLKRFQKPVVNDEPIGAADRRIPGRRESDPAVFKAMAEKTKALGLGATFHYEGGLQAKLPSRTELACLDAWLAGLR